MRANRVATITARASSTVLLGLFVFAAVDVHGQTGRFTTGVEVVRVDVLVTSGNRPITGLTHADFELRDNGVVQTISDVSRETLPLNVICALDVSGSVEGAPLAQLKQAMSALIDVLDTKDRAALVTFSDRLQIHTALTGDRAALRQLLPGMKAGGATALFDAIFASLALRESDSGRTLLLLFGDGLDTASWLSARKVLDAARRTDVVVYPIMVGQPASPMLPRSGRRTSGTARPVFATPDPGRTLFEEFADETGGRRFQADGAAALRTTFVDVLQEFRQRYVLSFVPSGVPTGGWHAIDVKLRGRSGDVKARRGYFASSLPKQPEHE
jgi:Ca-activated chloride channel family protein